MCPSRLVPWVCPDQRTQSPEGSITHLVGGSEHGGALGFKNPTRSISRPEPGTSQGYHPPIGRERPRPACVVRATPRRGRSPPTSLAPCSRRHRPQLWRLTTPTAPIAGRWGPGSFSASAGPDLTVSPSAGACSSSQGPTVEQAHVMYCPGLGGAPRARECQKKTSLPAGSDSRKAWDVSSCEPGPRVTARVPGSHHIRLCLRSSLL